MMTTTRTTMTVAAMILATALCVGCATPPPAGPVAWQAGYTDGCGSGESAAGYLYATYRKDVYRAQRDQLYASGWTDGFNACKSRFEANQRRLGPVFR